MKKSISILILALQFFLGCNDANNVGQDIPLNESDLRLNTEDILIRCKSLLSDGKAYCNPGEFRYLRTELENVCRQLPNGRERITFARDCQKMMETADLSLKNGDCQSFDREVFRFSELSSSVYNILKDADIDKRELMEYFLSSMERYRESCFKTAWNASVREEDLRSCEKKACMIQNLHARYQSDIQLFERWIMPAQLKFFPKELHEEYLRRARAFFDYPTRNEMAKFVHTNVVSRSQGVTKQMTQSNNETKE